MVAKGSRKQVEERAAKLKESPFRVIYHDEFDKPGSWRYIMADMPDIEQFRQKRGEIHKMQNGKIAPEMIPCYQEPLLSKEQELHLFRQMNYLKYRAKKEMGNMDPRRVGMKRIKRIESLLREATRIRNQIASSNFRLATMLLRKQSFREHSLTEKVIADAYFDILKAIDYFDYGRGNKFSTYATWVMRRNFCRAMQDQGKYYERFGSGSETFFEGVEDSGSGYDEELHYDRMKQMVKKFLGYLKKDGTGDVSRQVYAIEHWFGLNGHEKKTLHEISLEMGVTKERVRQLKEKGLATIRDKVEELNLAYEELD
jgi:RNA polymerase sigma factor (sigma-70 family)